MKNLKIGFVGMTHLGLVSGVSAAEKNFEVVCFDQSQSLINEIASGKLPVSEPELDRLFSLNRKRLEFTALPEDLSKCDLIYVAPDIATDDFGVSDLSAVDELLDLTFLFSRMDAVVVVLSQVPPGYVRKKQIKGRQLYYQVETLIFGQAVQRALSPERYIVGCSSPSNPLPSSYLKFLKAYKCKILQMRYESAELAKISINMFLVSSVTTANTLAELCEEIGADWAEIIPALRLDRRIGRFAYLNPGLGISGGNLERDLATLKSYASRYTTDYGIVDAWLHNSIYRKNWLWKVLQKERIDNCGSVRVSILGLTYKENTHSIKNSPAINFIKNLKGFEVSAYDPCAPMDSTSHDVTRTSSVSKALEGADVLVVATAWSEFLSLSVEEIFRAMRGKIIVDPYKVLDGVKLKKLGFLYYSLGNSNQSGE